MATAQLAGRDSLRDIESALASQKHLKYHLGSGTIKRATLSRTNQSKSSAGESADPSKFIYKRDLIELFKPPPDPLR